MRRITMREIENEFVQIDRQRPTHVAWLVWGEEELERAFQTLPGGPAAFNKEFNESWQYMGTFYGGQFGIRWMHQFRHRAHPGLQSANGHNIQPNERVYLNVAAPDDWQPQEYKPW